MREFSLGGKKRRIVVDFSLEKSNFFSIGNKIAGLKVSFDLNMFFS